MAQTELIYEALKADLTADRVLLEQVLNYIRDHYGFTTEELDRFFVEKYPELEEYEVDLTFSPQFTPTAADRLRYVPLLGKGSVSRQQQEEMVGRLEAERIPVKFITPDEMASAVIPLHEVMIARYVKLLKLDQKLDEEVYTTIEKSVSPECRPLASLLAREDVWQSEPRQAMLKAFLTHWQERGRYNGEKLNFLTNFLRTYRPVGPDELKHHLDSLIKSCQKDMDNVNGHGFHDEYLKAMYAESRIQSHLDDNEKGIWGHYYHMMDMAKLLLDDIAELEKDMPEALEQASSSQQPV